MSNFTTYDGFDYVYRGWWQENTDEAVKHLPLVSEGPWKILIILALYLWFVTKKGPEIMRNREPMKIKYIVLFYNIFLVISHTIAFLLMIWATDFSMTTWQCRKIDPINGKDKAKEKVTLLMGYLYFLSKFLELADTVFFILKKKNNQVTVLHVFHHTVMPFFTFLGLKFSVWHCAGWLIILNVFVHIVMYSYYTFALLNLKHLLWLKKYITRLQITQFLLILAHSIYFLQHKTCKWSKFFPFFEFFHATLFLYMFSSFYYHSYTKKTIQKKID